jgi:hypothetical protein
MAVTARTEHFGSAHEQTAVFLGTDVFLRQRRGEAWPAPCWNTPLSPLQRSLASGSSPKTTSAHSNHLLIVSPPFAKIPLYDNSGKITQRTAARTGIRRMD